MINFNFNMGFRLPRVQGCCCCFSLRTGSLIIGYISMVMTAGYLAMISVSLAMVVGFVNKEQANHTAPPGHTPEEVEQVALSVYIAHAFYLLVSLYYFIVSVLLVAGVHMERPKFLRDFIKSATFLLVLELAMAVIASMFMGFFATIPVMKTCLIIFYTIVVVNSACLEMEERQAPKVYEMTSLYNPPPPPTVA